MRHSHTPGHHSIITRFQTLFFVAIFLFVVIVGKLGWLQIVQASEYRALAEEQNSRGVVLPARRGTIYMRDVRTAELFPVAQNSTTYTIFADPLLIQSGTETAVAEQLTGFLFVPDETTEEAGDETEYLSLGTQAESEDVLPAEEEKPSGEIITEADFRTAMVDKLATKDVVRREIWEVTEEERQIITDSRIPGVGVSGDIITINPTLIDDPDSVATQLATILEADYDDVYPLMFRKKVRYARLATRVDAGVKNEILALGIRGIGAIPEYRRVYPERSLAAQIIGFLNNDEEGVGGIEGSYERVLGGKDGLRRTQVDPFNRQITVGDITIQEATDGADLVLTIDRSIQETVERELSRVVEEQRADGGQAIVMNPYTGAILALAHAPTFDPNTFGDAYAREELIREEISRTRVEPETGEVIEEIEEIWKTAAGEELVVEFEREYIVRDGWRYPVFREGVDGEIRAIYENRVGAGIFKPVAITDPYEPGSVFKSIVIAMGLDAGEIGPNTISPYSGPLPLGEFIGGREITINNSQGQYFGRETMTEVLAHSSNIGMAFIAETLGKATLYDYLQRFGFGERTDLDLEGENAGQYANYTRWSRAEHITKSFGQGLTVNMVQMATAYSALANGGLLMKPYLVAEQLYPDGRTIHTEPETVRRVISPEASATITGMLIASIDDGFANPAAVDGYFVGGKTGTSQTYSRSGRALTDLGTTIAAFGGYAPATNPKFVLIVKVDRPRVVEWGAAVAAPVFQRISEELLKNHFAIPPVER